MTPGRFVLLAACLLGSGAVLNAADPAVLVRELREERTQRTRQTTPGEYARIDAELAEKAANHLAEAGAPAMAQARDWAALMTIAGRHSEARDLLRRHLLSQTLTPAERHQAAMDLMLSAVKLDDGETVYSVLEKMDITPDQAANLGSYFGGTFHHFVFNARGAEACLQLIARIEPLIPVGPYANDEIRKHHGWAHRQLAAAKAFYLAELGRRQEAVAVLDEALATLDGDIFRREGLAGDRQRYQLLGLPAPAINVDRTHGEFPGVQAYRGKVLMLEFTAHWCHACHAAIPALRRLYAEMKDRGFEIVALTTYYGFFGAEGQKTRDLPRDTEFARMPALLEKQGVTWPMVYTDRATMNAYGVTGIPQIMLLDKQGRIRKIDLGFSEAKMDRFKAELETLLAE